MPFGSGRCPSICPHTSFNSPAPDSLWCLTRRRRGGGGVPKSKASFTDDPPKRPFPRGLPHAKGGGKDSRHTDTMDGHLLTLGKICSVPQCGHQPVLDAPQHNQAALVFPLFGFPGVHHEVFRGIHSLLRSPRRQSNRTLNVAVAGKHQHGISKPESVNVCLMLLGTSSSPEPWRSGAHPRPGLPCRIRHSLGTGILPARQIQPAVCATSSSMSIMEKADLTLLGSRAL